MFMLKVLLWHFLVTVIIFVVGILYIVILTEKRHIPDSVGSDCFRSYNDTVSNFVINITLDASMLQRVVFMFMYYAFLPLIFNYGFYTVIKHIDEFTDSTKKSLDSSC